MVCPHPGLLQQEGAGRLIPKKGKTQGGTWLRLEKLWSRCQNQRTLPCSSPGPGEQVTPQGHWSSMARQGPHEVSAHREEP